MLGDCTIAARHTVLKIACTRAAHHGTYRPRSRTRPVRPSGRFALRAPRAKNTRRNVGTRTTNCGRNPDLGTIPFSAPSTRYRPRTDCYEAPPPRKPVALLPHRSNTKRSPSSFITTLYIFNSIFVCAGLK